jgi:hypothetical protein
VLPASTVVMISFSTRIIRRPIIVSRQKIIRLFSLSTTNVRQGKESHLRADEKSTTCFWASRVVFYGIESPVRIDQGSILVNNDNGIIEACFHGETKEQAFARGEIKCTSFVDLSSINTAHSSRRDSILSPGLIDVHTHISTLGRNWEGYSTATAAAAKGGVSSIIGMPLNSLPPTCSVDMVEKEIEEANNNQSKLYVDVGLWAGVLSETASLSDQLEELLRHPNVLGIKAFLCPLPPNAGYQAVTPKQLLEVAKMCTERVKKI